MAIRSQKITSLALLAVLLLLSSCGTRKAGMASQPQRQEVPDVIASLTTIAPQPAAEPEVSESAGQDEVVEVEVEDSWEGRVRHVLDSLCHLPLFETTQLGLCVYDLTAGQQLFAFNDAQRMRPASCQKVVTGVAALHYLGGDYQFSTHLYYTGNISGGVLRGDVYVVGNSTNQYEFKKSFEIDNVVVSVVSILIVLVVLLFTFNSAGMPVLLIAVIQGAIWMNFGYPTVVHHRDLGRE